MTEKGPFLITFLVGATLLVSGTFVAILLKVMFNLAHVGSLGYSHLFEKPCSHTTARRCFSFPHRLLTTTMQGLRRC
jgi:hypothetical protein